MPLRKQGKPVGVLYLEHRRLAGVFTPQRLRTLRILATQAAISLENVQLREALQAENTYLRRDLIANVSHDLRTPLVSMRGYLELLATKGEALDAEQRRQYLGIAVRQSEHLATLIDELFELAKLDFKGMTLRCEPFAFAELAADVTQKFQLAADSRRIALRVEAAASLPMVEADLGLMERVLDNLIGNALQHAPEQGSVTVVVATCDGRLQVQVCDTGSGIPAEDLPFVFDRFYRGAHGRIEGGAGLGLAITRRILELHDSQIRVESDGKSGSRFSFSLPLHRATPGA
jgi:signal transduction histidine kinase